MRDQLQQALDAAGLTQADLARQLGISQPSVNAWFRGRSTPDISRMSEIARILKVRVAWLLSGDGAMRVSSRRSPDPHPETAWGFQVLPPEAMDPPPNRFAFDPGPPDVWDEDGNIDAGAAAWRTIEEIQARGAPVALGDICKALGLKVVQVEESDTFCGSIQQADDRGREYTIKVNRYHHPNRQRFTIAHEVAHWLEHRHLIGDGIVDDELHRSGLPSKIEREANRIAADILMPDALIEVLERECLDNVEDMARRLRVSKTALATKLGLLIDGS